jgi:hypothetical protein
MKIVREKAKTPVRFEKLNIGDVFYDFDNECTSMKCMSNKAVDLYDGTIYSLSLGDSCLYLEAELIIKE